MPSGINLVTGLPFDLPKYESSYDILNAELKELVLSEIPNKSSKHKSKKGGAAAAAKTAGTAAAANVAVAPATNDKKVVEGN